MKSIPTTFKIILLGIGFLGLLIALLFGHQDLPMSYLKSKYTNEASAFITVAGMEVHYRDEGPKMDPIPLVFIHGTGSSLHTFDGWTQIVKKDHRVIRMDLPGYGLTGPFPHRNYAIAKYVDFLNEFLYALGIKKCVLVGNSLGGNIAWNYTVKHPDRIDKLVLIDASGYAAGTQSEPLAFRLAKIPIVNAIFEYITPRFVAKSSIENVYSDASKVTPALVDRYFELTLREGNRQAFVDKFQAEKIENAETHIKNIQQPTLVLWGEDDTLIPISNAYKFHDDLPHDTLVIMKHMGHVPMEENPKESLKPLISFLKNE